MIHHLLIPILIILNSCFIQEESFKEKQMRYPRVRTAYNEKYDVLRLEIDSLGIENFNLFIRVLKEEKLLEVWIKESNKEDYRLFRQYQICRSSGIPGPKRRQGDYQVPEGFYHINVYNPYSNFFLSLGINYPNRSDRILSEFDNLGGDIYIHGSCVTIGCIPLTDEIIKELYVLVVEARTNGQEKIPVHIFPTRLDTPALETIYYLSRKDEELYNFWMNLKEGYDYFEIHRSLPDITISDNGAYLIR